MAHMIISTFGSSGDLNPFIALGLGLRVRDHLGSLSGKGTGRANNDCSGRWRGDIV